VFILLVFLTYIKMGPQEVGCEGTDWIELAQDGEWWWPLVNVVRNLRIP